MADNNNKSKSHPREVTLSRDLGLFTVTMIGVGGMIGAGIFVLTGIAAGVAGPALILAFLLNGLVTSLTAMSYAELGSAFPGAGGGYTWIKEALGGALGFLSGWMSWFAQAVAGSLYGLAFGRFMAEVFERAGLSFFGLTLEQTAMVFMSVIIVIFTLINYRGASETAAVGNTLTITKIFILGLLVLFGSIAMARTEMWHSRFTVGFMPNGIMGVFVAMGFTFIAFEGYEIIAQSGEEVIDPIRNIPRAIFASIGIAVFIYVLVGAVSIGATVPPEGLKAYEYLGEEGEIAIIQVAQQVFPGGFGGWVLLISGLASTTSALNATTYASSRVSFAMGRDRNLPKFFASIHPVRHTPSMAVIATGILMLLMAWTLPISDIASSASIMFLLLFLLVNVAVLYLRRQEPDLERGFRVPWFPWLPLLAILSNLFLAASVFNFSTIAWYFAIGWIIVGLLTYSFYFRNKEAMEKPKEILLEEVLISRDYSVLVPVEDHEQARILGKIASVLACDREGEVLALHVVQVPQQLSLPEGRLFLKDGRVYLDEVIKQAKSCGVPVHTIIRLGRKVPSAIRQTAVENASDLLVLGWPGYTTSQGRLFGSVADPIVDNPPTDVVIVRYREWRPLRKILVPVSGGLNSRRAVRLAVSMARAEKPEPAAITILHVLPPGYARADEIRASHAIHESMEGVPGIEEVQITTQIVEGDDPYSKIIEASEGQDLIVIGASEEPLFRNFLVGTGPERVARNADVTVMMVKRRRSPLHSFMREAILEPTKPKPLE
ncbi:MAG: amino acid permease [Anaerolineales bacterium]|jgi:amino acid transporter/nucleotide-binding universal stress UspA family protein